MLDDEWIRVRGARTHNLQNVDVDIPRQQLVVLTGVSGSGKSSLAFDTLFAEGQRRYLDCLSARTRQFMSQMARADVDVISGLPPTVCVDQRGSAAGIRSTLATTTEIFDYLRLLYARSGQAHCPACRVPVSQQSVQSIVQRIMALEERSKVMLLAPLVRDRKGSHREVFDAITRAGFVRARVNGDIVDVAEAPDLPRSGTHTIEAVVDRIVVKPGIEDRLRESVELALKHGEGSCLVCEQHGDVWRDQLFSSRYCCPQCGTSFPPLEPRTFSFNSPYGACSSCRGTGRTIPAELAAQRSRLRQEWSALPACDACDGARLGDIPRAVTVLGQSLPELAAVSVDMAAQQVESLCEQAAHELSPEAAAAAAEILPHVMSRLSFLQRVGLGYLSLDRPSVTLSGGEFQRARLAACLGSGLAGVCYILDEPTTGLHDRDVSRMLEVLTDLRDQGNSVLVVEHDVNVMRAADWLIDLGPGAGREGGRLVAAGTPNDVASGAAAAMTDSLDSSGEAPLPHPTQTALRRAPGSDGRAPSTITTSDSESGTLTVLGACRHNLKQIDVEFPLHRFVAVTGVSGSGKSSLVTQTLIPALRTVLASRRPDELSFDPATHGCTGLAGFESIDRLVVVDQSPIGRSGRSNPATQTGLWDELRRVMARTREAKLRGFTSRRFSFNAKDGRCGTCEGRGTQRVAMNFLPDLHMECPECRGDRFNAQTLSVTWRGRNAADILNMRVDEAAEFFSSFTRVKAILDTLCDVGLGYLQLGQSALTLSGGEAQRIRLATELSRDAHDHALFVLDEPTSGLHPADVSRLLDVLRRLIDHGHSVIVIEHDADVISASDWIIEVGPEGGAAGGHIMRTGPPGT